MQWAESIHRKGGAPPGPGQGRLLLGSSGSLLQDAQVRGAARSLQSVVSRPNQVQYETRRQISHGLIYRFLESISVLLRSLQPSAAHVGTVATGKQACMAHGHPANVLTNAATGLCGYSMFLMPRLGESHVESAPKP